MPDRPGSIPDTNLVALLIDVRTDVRDSRRETNDGFKQIHSRLERIEESNKDHAYNDEHGFMLVRGEIADVRSQHAETARKLAKIEGERTVEARVEEASFFNVGTNGTGRHRVVSENGDTFVLPTPPAGVPMELKYGKRESKPPAVVKWLGKALGKAVEGTAGKMVAATLGAAVAGIGGAYFHAAVTPTETRIVQIPATTPLPSAHVESPPAAATAFVASPVLDAGAPRRR